MEIHWPDTVEGARNVQSKLRQRVVVVSLAGKPGLVAGVDASYYGGIVFGAACLYTYPDLDFVESTVSERETSFPYVPGYLAFREGPALFSAISGLTRRPDVILLDGQGIAHPRGLGIASHLGVLLGIPSIGCAKSRLVGSHREPGMKKGSRSALKSGDGVPLGAVLRTREGVRPVFVSPGHLVDIESAVRTVLSATVKHRLPEPLRCAHRMSVQAKRTAGQR
jgi:deoxyribonuclease V